MEAIKRDIAAMGTRLDVSDGEKVALGGKVQKLTQKFESPPPPPPEPPPPAIDPAEIDLLRARMQRIADRIDELDGRITSISTELANQINELSGEIDSLGGEAPTDEVVDALRGAQVKLANEQARYQIAFRQDLAEIAERLEGR